MKEIWLFTMRYPFGEGEAFLENELPVLCERFERVRLFPLERVGTARTLPPNAEVAPLQLGVYDRLSPFDLLLRYGTFRKLARSLRNEAPSMEAFRAQWPELRSRIRYLLQRAKVLGAEVERHYDPSTTLLYSYWTHDWATVLSILRQRDRRLRCISRAHGFDLYADRGKNGWLPFRALHLEQLERIFCASQAGLDHLRTQHPQHGQRFELARLGTQDRGLASWSPSGTLRLVSCANLVPLKRVDLLVEALRGISTPVEWTHFGDGPERARLEAAIATLPANIQATLHGPIRNADLLAWYQRTPVDLFVHTSASEGGVPVALQEAASFGIPLLGIDAGGVREIVNTGTGVLLPADAGALALRDALQAHAGSVFASAAGRAGVRAFWNANFRADVNFQRFCDRLIALDGPNA
ncbi:MAG TPA: glycosyltransferase [Flavobacteriales bacterium]|jgi:glycosyltransferase involved in cell wall biosynthesis|nr:glycosyltransferase [Flavobacteriales bacterium]